MKKLNQAVDRFCALHPHFGISNLMKVIVMGNIFVYLLGMFAGWEAISFLSFDLSHVLKGEIWRLVTFVFVPPAFDLFSLALTLYFYYFVGNALEYEWGSAKFSLYYLSGALLSLIGTIIGTLIVASTLPGVAFAQAIKMPLLGLAGTAYINLSMFFAYAMLYPDNRVLLFFFLPVKMKWLAWLDGAIFAITIVQSLIAGNVVGWLLPVIALLNFAVYFSPNFLSFAQRKKYQHSRPATQFRKAVHRKTQEDKFRSHHHKCSVCGKTDAEFPNLAFRYCSRCSGYHCYCEEHIFNHVHFTDEN